MELPFLKRKRNQGGGGPTVELERESDSTNPGKLIDMVGQEMLGAFHKKDHAAFLHALRAFVLMINDEDKDNG